MQPSVVHIIHCIWWPLFYTSSYSPTRIYSHHRYLFLLLNIIICSKYNSLKTCTDNYYLAYLFVYHLWGTSYWWDLFMENLTKQCFWKMLPERNNTLRIASGPEKGWWAVELNIFGKYLTIICFLYCSLMWWIEFSGQ